MVELIASACNPVIRLLKEHWYAIVVTTLNPGEDGTLKSLRVGTLRLFFLRTQA